MNMKLKIGDILYLNPVKIKKLHEKNEYTFGRVGGGVGDIFFKFTFDELVNRPFEIIYTRSYNSDDVCIKWVDDTKWWWGQIGESGPWTNMFIDKKQYQRNKNLESLGV